MDYLFVNGVPISHSRMFFKRRVQISEIAFLHRSVAAQDTRMME